MECIYPLGKLTGNIDGRRLGQAMRCPGSHFHIQRSKSLSQLERLFSFIGYQMRQVVRIAERF